MKRYYFLTLFAAMAFCLAGCERKKYPGPVIISDVITGPVTSADSIEVWETSSTALSSAPYPGWLKVVPPVAYRDTIYFYAADKYIVDSADYHIADSIRTHIPEELFQRNDKYGGSSYPDIQVNAWKDGKLYHWSLNYATTPHDVAAYNMVVYNILQVRR